MNDIIQIQKGIFTELKFMEVVNIEILLSFHFKNIR